jgi:hypothetical protein
MLKVNDRHRVARDPPSRSSSLGTSSSGTALEILGIERIHVDVEPVVVVEVAVAVRGETASKVLACVMDV